MKCGLQTPCAVVETWSRPGGVVAFVHTRVVYEHRLRPTLRAASPAQEHQRAHESHVVMIARQQRDVLSLAEATCSSPKSASSRADLPFTMRHSSTGVSHVP